MDLLQQAIIELSKTNENTIEDTRLFTILLNEFIDEINLKIEQKLKDLTIQSLQELIKLKDTSIEQLIINNKLLGSHNKSLGDYVNTLLYSNDCFLQMKRFDYIMICMSGIDFYVSKEILKKYEDNYFSRLAHAIDELDKDQFMYPIDKNKIMLEGNPDVFSKIYKFMMMGECFCDDKELEETLAWADYWTFHEFIYYVKGYTKQLEYIPREYLKYYIEEIECRRSFLNSIISKCMDKHLYQIYNNPMVYYDINNKNINQDSVLLKNTQMYFYAYNRLYKRFQEILTENMANSQPTNIPIVCNIEDFLLRFNKCTNQIFNHMTIEEKQNILVAGGSISNCLQSQLINDGINNYPSDIDIFIYGISEEDAIKKVKMLCTKIYNHHKNFLQNYQFRPIIWRTNDAITIQCSRYYSILLPMKFQIILRLYKSISEVIMSFDIDSSKVCYNLGEEDPKKAILMTKTALFAYKTMVNIAGIDSTRYSNSYESRLNKYSKRGWGVYIPGFKHSDNYNYIEAIKGDNMIGLTRLIRYDLGINTKNIDKKPFADNNYEFIIIPEHIDILAHLENMCIWNRKNPNQVYPIIFSKNLDSIFDIFQTYTDDGGRVNNDEIDTQRTKYAKDKETYFYYKLNRNPNPIKILTSVSPTITLKTINPGEQIGKLVAGNYQDEHDFYSQVYALKKRNMMLDLSKIDPSELYIAL